MTKPPVAIVHDYLTQRGGAERVVLAMARAFPAAPLFTMLYDAAGTYPEFADLKVQTSALSRVPVLRQHHRLAFPLLAPTVGRFEVDADVAVCSSSGWAHGVRATGRTVVYCHAPARWLYQTDHHTDGQPLARVAVRALGPALRRWDSAAAARADRYLVNSTVIAAAVREHYGIEAEVLAPPVMIDVEGGQDPVIGIEPGAFVCVSRLMAYKHVDAVVAAFGLMPNSRLVVVGDGPDAARVRAAAPGNVRILGEVSDAQLRWLYANARGLVAAAYEDFGLTPLEAAAFGRPAAVLAAGGYLDTLIDGQTGVSFSEPAPDAIAAAVTALAGRDWDAEALRAHAATFSEARFAARLHAVVDEVQA